MSGPKIGAQLGGYIVREKLGEGGVGWTLFASQVGGPGAAAIKVLRPELGLAPALVDRYFADARAAAGLGHPGCVRVLDTRPGDPDDRGDGGLDYLASEFLEGESLAGVLRRRKKISPDYISTAAIVAQVADLTKLAHDKGLLHLDLKPENIFLCAPRKGGAHGLVVKVLDFGLGRLVDLEGKSRNEALLGTPAYMPPEQCRHVAAVGVHTDIYSLGCILFEMVIGRPPFPGKSVGEIVAAHLSGPAPELNKIERGVPIELTRMAAWMLNKEAANRPLNMKQVLERMDMFLLSHGSSAKDVSPELLFKEAPKAAPPPPPAPAPQPPPPAPLPPTVAKPIVPKPAPPPRAPKPRPPAPVRKSGKGAWVALGLCVAAGATLATAALMRQPAPLPVVVAAPPVAVERPPTPPAPPPPTPPRTVALVVQSKPSQAEVWEIGPDAHEQLRGTTPLRLELPANALPMNLKVKKSGFDDQPLVVESASQSPLWARLVKTHAKKKPKPARGGDPYRMMEQ